VLLLEHKTAAERLADGEQPDVPDARASAERVLGVAGASAKAKAGGAAGASVGVVLNRPIATAVSSDLAALLLGKVRTSARRVGSERNVSSGKHLS
jgi:hypothetical protein